jgi:hypothetical protein
MWTRNLTLLLALCVLFASVAVRAQEPNAQDGKKYSFLIQPGVMWRAGGGGSISNGDDHIITGDLTLFKKKSDQTWLGLGIKAAVNDRYGRWGLKAVLKKNFSPTSPFYWQVSPGVYLGGEKRHLDFPGAFVELELGYKDWLALAIMAEVKSYTHHDVLFDGVSSWAPVTSQETDGAVFLGFRGGGWRAMALAALAGVISQMEMSMSINGM